jgi:hypothetical protein
MSNQLSPSQPEIPGELWMLWDIDMSTWLTDGDYDSPVGSYLVCLSQSDAEAVQAYYENIHGLLTKPARVK